MTGAPIQFNDGAAYERMMGKWSRIAGSIFLDWLALPDGLRFADIGCGNGAFTELLIARCKPSQVKGVDPSEGQLRYARSRPGCEMAEFQIGDAMALPLDDRSFDVAAMALVLFFVPDPAKGLTEMIRVTRPGGTVAAYVWDMPGGGFPLAPLHEEMRALDIPVPMPPSADISRMATLENLWKQKLDAVETKIIAVERTFDGFEDFWGAAAGSPSSGPMVARLGDSERTLLQARLRARLGEGKNGKLTTTARANAIKGTVRR